MHECSSVFALADGLLKPVFQDNQFIVPSLLLEDIWNEWPPPLRVPCLYLPEVMLIICCCLSYHSGVVKRVHAFSWCSPHPLGGDEVEG